MNLSSSPNQQQFQTNVSRGGSRILFRRGCTRLLLYFNTNKTHSFFLQNNSCIRKPQVISGGGGEHPLHPPPGSAPVMGEDDLQISKISSVFKVSSHIPLPFVNDGLRCVPLSTSSPTFYMHRAALEWFVFLMSFACIYYM